MVAPVEALRARLVAVVTESMQGAIAARGLATLAVPGGSVASTLLPALVDAPVDWARVHVLWCDERAGPADGPASNAALNARTWLDAVPAVRHPMPAMRADLDAAARAYERTIDELVGHAPIDCCVLGVGEDGHVASLFPGHDAVRERQRRVLAVHDAPKDPPERLTLTLRCLASAGRVVVAAMGEGKRDAVQRALRDPSADAPVALLLRAATRPVVLADDAAGAGLAA